MIGSDFRMTVQKSVTYRRDRLRVARRWSQRCGIVETSETASQQQQQPINSLRLLHVTTILLQLTRIRLQLYRLCHLHTHETTTCWLVGNCWSANVKRHLRHERTTRHIRLSDSQLCLSGASIVQGSEARCFIEN